MNVLTSESYTNPILCKILRFYLATVFNHCKASSPLVSRKVSSIANSFLRIKKDLRFCHKVSTCHCGGDVKLKYGQIRSQYEKMDVHAATLKALGELDILLDWLDKAD